MKRIKRILGIIMVFLMVLVMLPITAKSAISDYDPYEVGKLQTFLNQPSTVSGKSNGQMINAAYNADDPATWTGVVWSATAPMNVLAIDWTMKSLAGPLDVSSFSKITTLYCNGNAITTLTVSGDTALRYLNCNNNQLSLLDLGPNSGLFNLHCTGNLLTDIDVEVAGELQEFDCAANKLTSLDLSNSTKLLSLDCSNNLITSLEVSVSHVLGTLKCSNNQLTSLNLAGATILYNLDCSSNQLTALDLSQSHNYTSIRCNNNQLTSINLDYAAELYYFDCTFNKLKHTDYSVFYTYVELETDGNGYVGFRIFNEGEYKKLEIIAVPGTGAEFIGWYHDDVFFGSEPNWILDTGEDYHYVAVFSEGEDVSYYHVTFDPKGGTRTGGGELFQEVRQGNGAVLPIVTRTGYEFVRWEGRYIEITEDETVSAIWSPVPTSGATEPTVSPIPPSPTPYPIEYYTVNFDPNGGTQTGGGSLSQKLIVGDYAKEPVVELDGYRFIGWDGEFDKFKDASVKAIWEQITYKVFFDRNQGLRKGGGSMSQTVPVGEAAIEPIVMRYGGYTFEGWDKPFDHITEDITITAIWKKNETPPVEVKYTVTYDANGGTGTVPADTKEYLEGENAVLAEGSDLSMEGYEFAGWSITPEGDAISEPEILVEENVTLYAVWKAIEVQEPEPTVIPVDNADIPKTGVPSGAYLGIIMLAFGGGIIGFEIIRKRKSRKIG